MFFFLFSMRDFPTLCQAEEIGLNQVWLSRDDTGSFVLNLFQVICILLGTIIPYNI